MNRLKKIFKKEKGITTIEVLTVIAIIGILLVVLNSLFSFTFRGHNQVQDTAQSQNNLILLRTYFNNELSNATEVLLLDSLPSPVDNSYYYIYLNNNSVFLRNNTGTRAIVEDNIDRLEFTIDEINENSLYRYILEYTINEHESSLILNNIHDDHEWDTNKPVIAYRRP